MKFRPIYFSEMPDSPLFQEEVNSASDADISFSASACRHFWHDKCRVLTPVRGLILSLWCYAYDKQNSVSCGDAFNLVSKNFLRLLWLWLKVEPGQGTLVWRRGTRGRVGTYFYPLLKLILLTEMVVIISYFYHSHSFTTYGIDMNSQMTSSQLAW